MKPIVVLRFNLRGLNHAELAIARSAGRIGAKVYGVKGGGLAVASSRYSAGRLHIDPGAPEQQRVERLLDIGHRMDRPLLVPIDDEASIFVSDHAADLAMAFLFPPQPDGLARQLAHKGKLHQLCRRSDVPTPRAEFPTERADVEKYSREGPFPVVVKRMAAWLSARVERKSVEIARNPAQLLEAYDSMESPEEPNILLQEYIPGTPRDIWMFNGYFGEASRCLFGRTGIKVRDSGRGTGETTLGVCVENRPLRERTVDLLSSAGYRGIVDLGYRYDARDGQFKLIDVNPRIGSTFRLFVGEGSHDVLRALYFDLTGSSAPDPGLARPRKWVNESFDTVSAFRSARAGQLSLRDWARSLRGIDETAWFARDDPLPFLLMGTEFLLHGARRRLRTKRQAA